jgi:hypothetical protein
MTRQAATALLPKCFIRLITPIDPSASIDWAYRDSWSLWSQANPIAQTKKPPGKGRLASAIAGRSVQGRVRSPGFIHLGYGLHQGSDVMGHLGLGQLCMGKSLTVSVNLDHGDLLVF